MTYLQEYDMELKPSQTLKFMACAKCLQNLWTLTIKKAKRMNYLYIYMKTLQASSMKICGTMI